MTLSITENIEEVFTNIKEFLYKNFDNPVLWLLLFIIGVFVFKVIYSSLHSKDKMY